MARIPTELKQIAEDLGCNSINYVTTTKDGEIYSLASVDDKGNYIPIGLPILYAVKGSSINEIDQDRAEEILSTIKE